MRFLIPTIVRRSRFVLRPAWPLALLGMSCTGGTEPSVHPRDLRVDPRATATVWGYVTSAPALGLPYRERSRNFRDPVVGVTVELGRWEGRAIDVNFRHGAPGGADYGPTRWIKLASTRTDAEGRFSFPKVPRYEVVSVLVHGSMWQHYPEPGRYEAALMEEIFWLAHTEERRVDIPVWDLER